MLQAKYPVAEILSQGSYAEYAYYVERSLGGRTFSQLFGEEFEKTGAVSHQLFDRFVASARSYLEAQRNAPRAGKDIESFSSAVHLQTLKEELPQQAEAIQERFDKAAERLRHVPYVLSHGDFNPANLYPSGAIDIENAINAPLGYDAVTAIETAAWFIKTEESVLFSHYLLSDEQIAAYRAMCDDVYKSDIPIAFIWEDLAFCRAMWMTVRMHKWPRVQQFRYDKFMKAYLD
jgi:Ser/Thr protein kinase RdoA (MazF antagonist)